jgi:16S rRNA (adenine1518-N6/adenine1519-N6)-dimethyltransferase
VSPKKSLGQHFVVEKKVIDALISESNFTFKDEVVEVGGGIGTLTFFLLQHCKKVISYEIDPILSTIMLKEFIQDNKRLKVISGDFLIQEIPSHHKLVSNLPYSISSPFFQKITDMDHRPERIAITIQSDFANHLCAIPGESNYSRISVFTSYFYKFEEKDTFPPNCFYPKPKVNSSLVCGNRLNPPKEVKESNFAIFLTNLFCRKHKKVRNNLRVYRKTLQKEDRPRFIRELDKLEYSSTQPINLTPIHILDLFTQFEDILHQFNHKIG